MSGLTILMTLIIADIAFNQIKRSINIKFSVIFWAAYAIFFFWPNDNGPLVPVAMLLVMTAAFCFIRMKGKWDDSISYYLLSIHVAVIGYGGYLPILAKSKEFNGGNVGLNISIIAIGFLVGLFVFMKLNEHFKGN